MGLRDQLRKADKETPLMARRQADRAPKEWADAERRLRQKMRIYPERFVSSDSAEKEDEPAENADQRLPVGGRAAGQLCDPEAPAVRKTIVSIHGRDVDDEPEDDDCGHLIQSR